MKKTLAALLMGLCAVVAFSQSRYPVEDKETIRRTLEFAGSGAKTLDIDNLNGSVRVIGYNGSSVEMVAHRTIRAETQDKVELAKQEVRLDITERAQTIGIYVDDPHRGDRNSRSSRRRRDPGYRVTFDFEVRVPHETGLMLSTVNSGEVRVENTSGKFDVENVNGGIAMTGIAGSGLADTVNGKVNITFVTNPKADSSFSTVNGDITVNFRPDLSANLQFKTFNGDVYTDFPVTAISNTMPAAERRNGATVYKGNRFSGYRAGNGGPELRFETLNGDIRVVGRAN